MKHRYLLLLPVLTALSCTKSVDRTQGGPPESIEGYAPVYAPSATAKTIEGVAPQSIVNAGKIYVKGTTLFQVESGKGIHVISIADITKPVKLGFIRITGCEELSIKDNYLYANNINDLVVVDIADLSNSQLKHRMANAFHLVSDLPPVSGWYECIDPDKGVVVGWTRKTLNYPECGY